MSNNLYDQDFYAWTVEQVKHLQQQQWHQLDVPNLIEEIASLGRQERQELVNRLGVLMGHLLKWQYQPDYRSKSWKATIREQRFQIQQLLKASPSLKPFLPEAIQAGHEVGLALVVKETPLDYPELPTTCPYGGDQILDPAFLPH
jgi:hypothetical protein